MQTFRVSNRFLKNTAAFVWCAGGAMLLVKSVSLLIEADAAGRGRAWPWVAASVGLIAGVLRAKSLFARSCRRNLDRIAALEDPMIWQFFRPRFFLLLLLMIAWGAGLTRAAHQHYPLLVFAAALDLGVAVGLLGSSYVFWTHAAL